MNKQYRIVWNESTRTWVAVAEIARSHGKSKGTHTGAVCRAVELVLRPIAMALALWGGLAYAAPPLSTQLPTGGQVVAGQAAIGQAGNAVLNVNQSSNAAVINWNTFNLGSAATVNFLQPSSSAAVLNRVLDANPSQIYGRISAPGQVFFSNPSGMYFGPSASVDVGSFTATTHSISTADFMAGNYRFTREGATGAIVNEGHIQAALGGYVALLAPEVRNHGVVLAQMGTVALAAGETYQLQIQGSHLTSIEVTPATIATLVENGQAVLAPEGWIVLSAKAAQQLEASVVNTGQLAASSLVERGGRIVLESTGAATVGGSIQANSDGGRGGDITITGKDIVLDRRARLEAVGATGGGTVLVGGDWQGSGNLPQATTVTMDAGANIDASATQNGDGGKVVLWSDVHKEGGQTSVHGSISARGGAQGGKGGQVETSGHQVDIAGAQVNAGADQGQGGLWLLDPYDYTIGSTEASAIVSSLNTGTSFTLDTANASSGSISGTSSAGAGNITISNPIAKASGGAATLTLNAGGDIAVNANISSTSGALSLSMTAGAAISGTGNLALLGGTATFNQATAGTYSGVISGTGTSLVKQGNGTLTLSGVNAYTGTTTVSGGTLQIGAGSTSGTLGAGAVSVASGATLAFSRSDSLSLSLSVTGAGSITKMGSNTLTLTNSFGSGTDPAANFTGSITINGGTLALAGAASQSYFYGSAINVNNGSTLSVTSTDTSLKQYWFSTSINFDSAGGGRFVLPAADTNFVIGGSRTLTINTNGGLQNRIYSNSSSSYGFNLGGTLALNTAAGTNTGTGDLSIELPLVNGGNITKSGTGSVVMTNTAGNVAFTTTPYVATTISAGTLMVGNGGTAGQLGSGTVTIASGGNLTFNRSDARTIANLITGAGGITQAGSGTTTLSGANAYTGTTTVNAGTLKAGSTSAFGSNSAVTLANVASAVLNLNGYNISIGSLAGGGSTGGNVTLGASTLSTGGDNTSTSYAGVISGTGGLTKAGSGTLTLTGTNLYSGTTTISAGTLQIGNAGTSGTLGTGAVSLASAGTLAYNRSDDLDVGPTVTGSGTITKLGSNNLGWTSAFGNGTFSGTLNINGGTLTIKPPSAGFTLYDSTLNINNASTLAITDTSGSSGANLSWLWRSTVNFDATGGGRIDLASNVNFANTSMTYRTNGGAMNRITSSSGSNPGVNLDPANGVTFDIASGTGAAGLWVDQTFWNSGNVTKTGAGVLQLSGNKYSTSQPTWYGSTTVNAGTLVLGDGTSANGEFGAGNVTLASGTLLKFNRAAGGAAIANVITGAGNVEQAGSGTTILTGANDYSGTTTISAGTLQIGNAGTSGTLGTGAVSVASNATLAFKRSDSLFVRNSISGAGGVTQSGSGTVFLNAGGTLNLLNAGGNTTAAALSTLTTGGSNVLKLSDGNWFSDGSNGQTITLPTALVAKGRSVVIWHNSSSNALNIAAANTSMGSALNMAGGSETAAVFTFDGSVWQYRGSASNAAQLATNATANSYTGATTVQTGSLDLLGNALSGAYTAGSALTVASGASMMVGGGLSNTFSNLSGGGNITGHGTGSTLSITESSATTYSGVLLSDLALTKTGAATLTLSGNNSYSGATTISAGTLQIGDAGTSGTLGTGAVSVASTATLTFNRSNAITVTNNIGGAGNLVQAGTGTTTLEKDGAGLSYTGSTTVNAGALTFSSPNWSSVASSAFYINNGSSLNFLGTGSNRWDVVATATSFNFDNTGGNTLNLNTTNFVLTSGDVSFVTAGGSSNTINGTGTGINTYGASRVLTFDIASATANASGLVVNAPIVNPGSIVKTGAGILKFSGTNTYTGTTTVNAGTLQAGSTSAFGNNSAVTLANVASAVLDLNGNNVSIGSLAGGGSTGGNVTLGAGTLTTGGNNTSTSYAGVISGTGGLTKTGTGTQTLSGANTYSGATTVNAGTLQAGSTSAFGNNSAVTLANVASAVLDLNGNNVSIGSLAGGGSTGGNVTLGAGTLTTGGNNTSTSYAGVISGTGGLSKAGTGTFILTGTNTYSGITTIGTGTLTLRNDAPTTASSTFKGPGSLVIESSGNSFSADFSTSGWTFDSVTPLGGLTIGKSSNTAAITLASATTVAGPITVTGGNIAINAAVTATGSNTISLSSLGNITQTGALSATNLLLEGNSITLANSSNAIGTLAVTQASALTFVNSTALTIGTVNGSQGVAASGVVDIATRTGDLTLANNVFTMDTGNSAITLNAGSSTAAGNSTGGNIVVSGGGGVQSGFVGFGVPGVIRLYTGSTSGSTGLAALAGGSGSGRYRYGSDESSTNYSLALDTGANVVYREQPSITRAVVNQTITYGDALPSTTFSVSGGANGDTYSQVFGSATAPTVTVGGSTSTSNHYTAGSHTLSATGGATTSQLGYAVTSSSTSGTLTVNTKTLTVNYSGVNKTYDGFATASVTTSDNRVTNDVLTITRTAEFANSNPNVGTGKTVSISSVSLSGTDAGNYTLASTTGTTTADITKAHLTVTADNKSKTYGDANPTLTTTVSGFVNGENLSTSGVTGSGTASTTADATTGAGTAVITAGVGTLSAANYDFTTLTNGTLTIGKAHLTVTADNKSKTYGDANPTLTTTVSGFVNGENLSTSGVTGSGTASTTATASTGAGTAVITAGVGTLSAANYDFTTLTNGTLTIGKAHLTVTADNKSKTYGDANPTLTTTVSGFVNGENLSTSGVTGSGTASTTADATTGAGTAVITAGVGTLSAANYDFTTLTNGTLTIGQAALTVTATAASKTYDGQTYSGGNGVTYSGWKNSDSATVLGGTLSYAGNSQGAVNAGSYTITPQGLTSSNYAITFASGTLTVNRRLLTLSASKTYDGGTSLTGALTLGNLASGENLGYTGATASDAHVATSGKYITALSLADGSGAGAGLASNYALPTLNLANAPVTVTARALSASSNITGASSKTYDGSDAATGASVSSVFTGAVSGDSLTLTGVSLAYNSAHVVGATTISASGTPGFAIGSSTSGSLSSDYQFTAPTITSVAGNITARALTASSSITGSTSKTYDGLASATGAGLSTTFSGQVAGDSFTLTGLTLNYNDAHVAGATTIGASGTAGFAISSTSNASVASDYSFTASTVTSVAGSITAKALTATASIGGTFSKTYDGSDTATGATLSASVTGAIGSDTVNFDASGLRLIYNSSHVVNATTIGASGTAGFTIANSSRGSQASDYSFTGPTITSVAGSITARALSANSTITGTTSKTYDGNTTASGASLSTSFSGGITDDSLSLGGLSLVYNDAHVAGANTISASGTPSLVIGSSRHGSLSSDYSFTVPSITSVSGTITARALTSTASIGGTVIKTYDGLTSASGASVSGTVYGALSGDTINLNTSGLSLNYNNAHVQNATTISASGSAGFVIGSTSHASVASDYSFTGPTITSVAGSITARALSVNSSITGTTSKTYDGSDAATGASVSSVFTGAVLGDSLTLTGVSLAYNSAHVAGATTISASGTPGFAIGSSTNGSLTSDYQFTVPTIASVAASITAKALTSTASITGVSSKTYDGNAVATGASVGGTVSGAIAGDTITLDTSGLTLAYNSAHVAGATTISASGSAGFVIGSTNNASVASDYSFTGPTINAVAASITARALSASSTITGTTSKTYDGNTTAGGASLNTTFSGQVAGDSFTLTGLALNYNDAHVAGATTIGASGTAGFSVAGTSNASVASDYSFTGPTVNAVAASITAKALTATASIVGANSKTYDGSTAATGASVSGTVSGAVSGDTITLDTSGLTLAYNNAHVVGASSIGASGSAGFAIASTNNASVASDYSFTVPTITSVAGGITARALSASSTITGTTSKTYDGNTTAGGASLTTTFSGQVAGDSFTLTGLTLAYNDAHVAGATTIGASGTAGFSVAGTSNTSVASDYSFTAPTVNAVAASITAKALTATASIVGANSKTYDGTTAATGASVSGTVSGAIAGDTITLDTSGLTLAYNNAHVVGASSIGASGSAGFTIVSSSHTSAASDYSFTGPSIAAVSASVTAKTLTASLANTGVSKTYDGGTSAPSGFAPSYSFSGLVTGDTAASLSNTGAAYNNANVVGANKLTVSGLAITGISGTRSSVASDYVLSASSADVAATITPKSVTVAGLSVSDKTYDGTSAATVTHWGSVSTGVGSQTLTVSGTAANFASANVVLANGVPQAQSVSATGLALGDGTGLASNYQLTSTSASSTARITPAALTVRANNDAKFVTTSDASGYAGVSYSGWVNNEGPSALGGSVTISRSNSSVNTAGSYSGVLTPSGLSSSNYSIGYVSGDYTIVPSNQLLVTVNNASTVYGSAASYSVASAQYYDASSSQVVTLNNVTVGANSQVTVNDGAGGVARFTLAPQNAALSAAQLLRVGSYQLGVSGTVTENSQNFSNTITVVGAHAVTQKGLTVTVTGGLSKTYDGSAAMSGLALGLTGTVLASSAVQAGDAVTLAGSGAYAGKNAGTGLGYTVSNLALSGADAANYVLASNSLTGSNGVITAKALTLSAAKTYDGGTSLTGAVTLAGLVGSETLGYSGATSSDAHVAQTGKYISAITLADGSNGGLAANYALPTLDAANAPVTIMAKALTASAGITGAVSKTYDGNAQATGASVSGTVSGAVAGDTITLSTTGVSLAYNDAHVQNAATISASGSAGFAIASTSNASVASDYSFSAPTINPVLALVHPAVLTASLSNTGVGKTYDGSTAAPSGFAPSWSLAGLVSGDTAASLANTGIAYNSANVSTANKLTVSGLSITGVTGSHSSVASDYVLASTSAEVGASISAKSLTVSGLAAAGKTYDGTTIATVANWGSVSTGVGSETLTLGHGSAVFGSANAGSQSVTASGYSLADGSNGGLASNYVLSSTSASTTATIDRKTISLSASKTYDGSNSLTGAVTLGGLIGSETLGYTGATVNDVHVATAGKYVNALTLSDGGNGGLAANYALPTLDAAHAPVSITAKALTATASIGGSTSKTYDGGTAAMGASVSGTVSGAVGGDTITLSTTGVSLNYNDAHVLGASSIGATGNVGFTIASSTSGSLASDYSFTVPTVANVAGSITAKALTASASIGGTLSKTYDGSASAHGAHVSGTVSGAIAGDQVALDVGGLTLAYNSAHVADANRIGASGTAGFGIVSSTQGSQSSDYSLTAPTIAAASASITPRTLIATLTNTGVSKTYDGSTDAPSNFAPTWTVAGLLNNDTGASLSFASAAYNSKNVTQATQVTVTVSGQAITAIQGNLNSAASDYALSSPSATVTASITPKLLTITGLQVADKTYDGSTRTTVNDWGRVSTGVGNETLSLNHGLALFDSANAGNRSVTASGYSLVNGGGGGLASNYALSSTSASTTATIGKALLTVTANSDAKFVTTSDAAGYAGVSYSGFVNGETSTVLGTAPTVSRSNSGVQTAGTYSGVLSASGGVASNYNFAYASGDYTIVPANQLLVRVNNLSTSYGATANYSIASASYYDANARQVITLGDTSVSSGNQVTVNDGAGGRASFLLAPRNSSLSSAQLLRVGSYALGISGAVTENSQNFSDTITLLGSQTVTPKALVVSTTDGISKVYDGTTTMHGVSFALTGVGGGAGIAANDLVTVSGNGNYASKNAGTQLAYTVNNLSLGGADASNYTIATGSSFSGGNGTILPKALVLTALADSKTHDGSTRSNRVPVSGALAMGDTMAGLTQSFDSSAVGARILNVSTYTISDGNGGHNYAVTLVPANGSIMAQQLPPPPVPSAPPVPGGIPGAGGGTEGGSEPGPGGGSGGGAGSGAGGGSEGGPGSRTGGGAGGGSTSGAGSGAGGGSGGSAGSGAAVNPVTEASGSSNGPSVRVWVLMDASEKQGGLTRIYVPRDLLTQQADFVFVVPMPKQAQAVVVPTAVLRDGSALPDWLSFDPAALRFTARKVPANGLPLLARVRMGAFVMDVDVVESAQP